MFPIFIVDFQRKVEVEAIQDKLALIISSEASLSDALLVLDCTGPPQGGTLEAVQSNKNPKCSFPELPFHCRLRFVLFLTVYTGVYGHTKAHSDKWPGRVRGAGSLHEQDHKLER